MTDAQVARILERRAALLAAPVPVTDAEGFARCEAAFVARTPGSRELGTRRAATLAGGLQHRASPGEPYPLMIARADGGRVIDVDGNDYVDCCLAGGTFILGHGVGPPPRAPFAMLHHPAELELAERLVGCVAGAEALRFFQSGSEAVAAALRLVRCARGRRMVLKVDGSYHGWMGPLLRGLRLPGTDALFASGEDTSSCRTIFPNDTAAIDAAFRDAEALAGVFLELPGPESGRIPLLPSFVTHLARACEDHGVPLVLDEVITGLRLGRGGAQAAYGIEPDLTVLGKIIGGGTSLSAVVGRRELLRGFDISLSAHAAGAAAFVGGTLAASSLSTAAGLATLDALTPEAYARIDDLAAALVDGLESVFSAAGAPFFAYRFGSIVQVELVAWPDRFDAAQIPDLRLRVQALEQHQRALRAMGVLSLAGMRYFTCAAHTPADVDRVLEGYRALLGMLG